MSIFNNIFNSLLLFKGKLRLANSFIRNKKSSRDFILPKEIHYSVPN